jgi:hypothetical protein
MIQAIRRILPELGDFGPRCWAPRLRLCRFEAVSALSSFQFLSRHYHGIVYSGDSEDKKQTGEWIIKRLLQFRDVPFF